LPRPSSARLPLKTKQETNVLPNAKPVNAVTAARLALAPPNLFAGTSGWAYPTWKPGFYPATVPTRAFLHFYATQLTSVEVNYTFRTLPSAAQLQGWLDATPRGFRFSFKAPQRITHFQSLRDGETAVADFIAALQPARAAAKLGPLLFQLPPNFAADHDRLAAFLATPALVEQHAQLQIAFEFRHTSWFTDATYDLLRAYNAALCVAESDDLVTPDIVTADFRYYRLRRSGGYTDRNLNICAKRFAALAEQGEVFVYFKHEDDPTGALNAVALLQHADKILLRAGDCA
jgi:uncharacterized protein YecE (DUF72 family)